MVDFDLNNVPRYHAVLVQLLKGPLYAHDQRHWDLLVQHQREVQKYFGQMPLKLHLDEVEGYAFLKPLSPEEEEAWQEEFGEAPPRLISRRKLSYGQTIILVLLRKRLLEHDAMRGDTRLILVRQEIQEMVQVFLPDETNQARLTESIDTGINKLQDIGILRALRNDPEHLEVNRILKAKVTPAELEEIITLLRTYKSGKA